MAKVKKLWVVSFAALVAVVMLGAGLATSAQKALAEDAASNSATFNVTVSTSGASNGASATIEKAAYTSGETAVLKWSGGKDGDNLVIPSAITFNNRTYNVGELVRLDSVQTANTEYQRRMGSAGTMTTFENLQSYVAKTHTLDLGTVTVESTVTVTFTKVAPVYRMYNMISSEHLFTTQKAEYDNFVELGKTDQDYWIGEGISWLAPAASSTSTAQVYRLYNAGLGALGHSSHYYTSDEAEKTSLVSQYGWADDGTINGFLSGGTTAIYTCYNEALGSAHHYTSSKTEWQGLDQHGWALEQDKNGTNPVKTPEGVFQCSLATQWSFDGNYYTVRHILDGDTANAEIQYVSGKSGETTAAAAKTIAGYTAGDVTQTTIASDNSTQVDINYTSKTYTIKFNSNGTGTPPADATGVKYGASIKDKKPTDLTDTTKKFVGWCYDGNRAHEVNWETDTMPATDMTLYAAWSDTNVEVVISFDSDGGSTTPGAVIINKGAAIGSHLPTSAGTKTGYTFDGWYNGETKVDATTTFDTNTTLKAKWTAETPAAAKTVSFNTRGDIPEAIQIIVTGEGVATDDGAINPKKTGDDGKLTETLPAPAIDGYTFDGWYNGDTKVDANTVYSADTTLTAKWKVKITFDSNGGSTTGLTSYDLYVAKGTLASAGLTSLPDAGTRDGYSSYKWTFNGDVELTEALLSTQTFDKATKITAVWTISESTEKVTITLNNITPYDHTKTSTIEVAKGQKPQRPADPYDGTLSYDFVNWYTVAPTAGQNESNVFDWDKAINENTNIYAGWSGIVTVVFNSNVPDGSYKLVDNGMVTTQRVRVGAQSNLPACKWVLEDTSGNDYGFMGWGYGSNSSTVDYRDRETAIKHQVAAGSTVVLNAIWTKSALGDYWIAPSMYIITSATANPDKVYYNNPLSGVTKTETDIKADLEVIKDTSKKETEEYKKIVATYTNYMNSDDYHLYTQLAETAGYTEGAFNENDYVEFRIINVGGHSTKKSDSQTEDDGSVITFQMTHALNTAYGFNNTYKLGGWTVSDLRNSIIDASGTIYKMFRQSFVEKLRSVTKYTREGWDSSGEKSHKIMSTADKFFLLSYSEMVTELAEGYKDTTFNYDKEGNQYQFYQSKGFTGNSAFGAFRYQGYKRDTTSMPYGATQTGMWWIRSTSTSNTKAYQGAVAANGQLFNSDFTSTWKNAIVLCFTVGRN